MGVMRAAASYAGKRIHLVGAKGTGMAALAELLASCGAVLSGSDVAETFYTDAILQAIGVQMGVGFEAQRIGPGIDLVVHSAAYGRDSNPELLEAARRGIPLRSYPEALGDLSRTMDSSAIAGVHGKTTTTAMAGAIAKALLPEAAVLAGSAVAGFGGRSTWVGGDRFFIAETCEYRDNFLNFAPKRVVLTSVEHDHQDYFPTLEAIAASFERFLLSIPDGGLCVYCADDPGARSAASSVAAERPGIRMAPYGKNAGGPYAIESTARGNGYLDFTLARFPGKPFRLRVPGAHNVLNATAAIALCQDIFEAANGRPWDDAELALARDALEAFRGSKRRSEVLGEAGGVLFMDDYAHHPTAIRTTLQGIRDFHPDKRLVVDFMSHTYSRTAALLDEFAASFGAADLLVLHKIYASAREKYEGGVTGRSLFELAKERGGEVVYFEEPMDALPFLKGELKKGDLFLSMGAGDNFRLAEALLREFRAGEGGA